MSIVSTDDPGFGSPLRVVFLVDAIGSTDAAQHAKSEAREHGYRVKTMGWIRLDHDVPGSDERRERMQWLVMLCVRPVAA
jgi:hypothetical protein